MHTWLSLYKRLASADKAEQIDTMLEEITDRFGKLPSQGQTLFDLHRLRVLAKPYGVIKIDASPGIINLNFRPNPPIDPMRVIELVQKNRNIKLVGNEKLRIEKPSATRRTAPKPCVKCCVSGPTQSCLTPDPP